MTEADQTIKEDGKIYEIGYLIVPTVSAENLPAEVTKVKDVLEARKAVVISEEFPKFRPLAYEMRKSVLGRYQKFTNAYFGWVKFEVGADEITPIKQELERTDSILRFLLIKTVRESTLVPPKTFSHRAPEEPREAKIPAHDATAPKTTVSEAEIDKSIEALISE